MRPHCDTGAVGRGSEHRQTARQKIHQQYANPEGSAAVLSGLSAQGLAIVPLDVWGTGFHGDSRPMTAHSTLTIDCVSKPSGYFPLKASK